MGKNSGNGLRGRAMRSSKGTEGYIKPSDIMALKKKVSAQQGALSRALRALSLADADVLIADTQRAKEEANRALEKAASSYYEQKEKLKQVTKTFDSALKRYRSQFG